MHETAFRDRCICDKLIVTLLWMYRTLEEKLYIHSLYQDLAMGSLGWDSPLIFGLDS